LLTFYATYETSYMNYIIAIFETWSAFMTRYLVIMLDDAHDQNFIWILTSRMLQSPSL
jgi:hypothetical protein